MSKAIWETLLQRVQRYPSPENTQPWSFRLKAENLEIYWLPQKGSHFFDTQNNAACLSLGSLYEYLAVAAQNLQFKIRQEGFDTTGFDGLRPVLVLSLTPAQLEPSDLSVALSQRFTNRAAFKKINMPFELKEKILNIASEFPGLQILVSDSLSYDFIKILSRLEAQFWSYPQYLRDLLKNIFFTERNWRKQKAGIFHRELGIGFHEKAPLSFAKIFPIMQKMFPYLGAKWVVSQHNKKLIENSHFVFLGAEKPTAETLLNVGRAGTRAWLMLNKEGLSVHPMTALGLQIYELNTNDLPNVFTENHKEIIQLASHFYKDELGMDYPAWVLRFGESVLPIRNFPSRRNENILISTDQSNLQVS
jgi:hypothetical protein